MTIIRCERCGMLLHKADRCFSCGNTMNFTKVSSTDQIHENVKDEYAKLEVLLKDSKYSEALELSRKVLEWMPSCSDVFWIRLLAKNNCCTDEALIRRGVSCEDSADYYNALLFADDMQKAVYTTVAGKIEAVKKVLAQQIDTHEYSEKSNTVIVKVQSEFLSEIETHRKKLFQLWEELEQTESKIMEIEKDCDLLIKEYKKSLGKASAEARSIKSRVYQMEQCTAEELHKLQIQLGNSLNQSEQAKGSISSIRKQHPWIETYRSLVRDRDSIVSQINDDINTLKAYESRVQSIISEIERIEVRHSAARISVSKYHFSDIRSMLGENLFMAAFNEAGVK